ncbi:MAG: threonylcarbamoyl-AMP synthase [Puniceicoccales bacterium]|jgi:L-threonylcarbamoyladenylate synthase|nr:threonylcarbamoyl-AMP synthase [Puniceicoccales bacterium]
MANDIAAAIQALKRGDVVVLPTETVYGLAANALNVEAVEKIYRIKGRPHNNPLILHVLDGTWIEKYARLDQNGEWANRLAEKFWPGPLTFVLEKKNIIPHIVTAGSDKIAIRCPNHELFRSILQACNFPLAAPSANPFGYLSPTTAEQVRQTLGGRVEIIMDGGPCQIGLESTIIDITRRVPKILRPGAIEAEEISEALGATIDAYEPIISESPTSPGQLKRHYSTHTKLVLFPHGNCEAAKETAGKVAIILNSKPSDFGKISENFHISPGNIFWFSESGELGEIARNLFATLQKIDDSGYGIILCERPVRNGIGIAIDDRLLRAAADSISGHRVTGKLPPSSSRQHEP